MTELYYKIGETLTSSYACALRLADFTGDEIKRIYKKPEQYTPEQKAAFSAHAKKAAEYRAANKK